MKKLLTISAAVLLLQVPTVLAPATVWAQTPPNCADLGNGYIRDGVTSCARLLVVNADGSINTTTTVSGATPATVVSSATLTTSQVIAAVPGSLKSFNVSADSTLSGAAWWIMIFDAATDPAAGAVTPAKCYAMPSGATGIAAAFPTPAKFNTGIVISVSTTGCFTKTNSAHAFISGDF